MSFTGYRIYIGKGSLDSVDFTSPVGSVESGAEITLSGYSFDVASFYTLVLRPVLDDLETPDLSCRCDFMTDSQGNYLQAVPARVEDLYLSDCSGDAVSLSWSYDGRDYDGTIEVFEVIAAQRADFKDYQKVAEVNYTGQGNYCSTIEFAQEQICWFCILVRDEADMVSRRSNIIGPVKVDMTAPLSPDAGISSIV